MYWRGVFWQWNRNSELELKISFASSRIPIEDIILGTEIVIKNIDLQNQDIVRKPCMTLVDECGCLPAEDIDGCVSSGFYY